MLFKIYSKNIVVVFPFFHPYVSFFFLLFFLHHTRIPIYLHPLPLFFSTFHLIPEPPSLFLSLALFLIFFFFSFSTWFQHIIQLSPFLHFFFSFSTIIFKHTQTCMERKEKSPLLHHTATAAAPPHTYVSIFFLDFLLLF